MAKPTTKQDEGQTVRPEDLEYLNDPTDWMLRNAVKSLWLIVLIVLIGGMIIYCIMAHSRMVSAQNELSRDKYWVRLEVWQEVARAAAEGKLKLTSEPVVLKPGAVASNLIVIRTDIQRSAITLEQYSTLENSTVMQPDGSSVGAGTVRNGGGETDGYGISAPSGVAGPIGVRQAYHSGIDLGFFAASAGGNIQTNLQLMHRSADITLNMWGVK